jgi:hypothetical protein
VLQPDLRRQPMWRDDRLQRFEHHLLRVDLYLLRIFSLLRE